MYGDNGIDRYEAQSIAESAAQSAASDAKREIGYDIQRCEDDLRSLRHALDDEREARRIGIDGLYEMLEELRGIVGELTKAPS